MKKLASYLLAVPLVFVAALFSIAIVGLFWALAPILEALEMLGGAPAGEVESCFLDFGGFTLILQRNH